MRPPAAFFAQVTGFRYLSQQKQQFSSQFRDAVAGWLNDWLSEPGLEDRVRFLENRLVA
jgi:hypothetical protein